MRAGHGDARGHSDAGLLHQQPLPPCAARVPGHLHRGPAAVALRGTDGHLQRRHRAAHAAAAVREVDQLRQDTVRVHPG